jgi:hypothetical protein
MMPKSRKVKPGKLGKQIAPADFSEWASICRGGHNGMSLMLMSLTWWHDNLAMNEEDSDNYTLVVNDLIWVLGVLIEGGNSGKITWLSDEEADAGRRGSKRTASAAQQNVETLLKSKRYVFAWFNPLDIKILINYLEPKERSRKILVFQLVVNPSSVSFGSVNTI